jgi:hypothetical protein
MKRDGKTKRMEPTTNTPKSQRAIFAELSKIGWTSTYTDEFYENIIEAGFNRATVKQAFVLAQIVEELGPITVRGAFYRAVSAGIYPNTDKKHYGAAQRAILKLRRKNCVSWSKVVDGTRHRDRPSCWNGVSDFMETVQEAYRRDFWTRQPFHIELFSEKDAMSGILRPVTRKFQVYLNTIRGQVSETMVQEIGVDWSRIKKPIIVFYLGDHDPDGIGIEKCLKRKLESYCGRPVHQWRRLAIDSTDFADPGLKGFAVKKRGHSKKWQPYLEQHGDRCLEVDALSPDVIRQRVEDAIKSKIDERAWQRMERVEEVERASIEQFALAQKGLRRAAA